MKVAIATTTLYLLDSENSKIRAQLALDFMKKALESGYELSVVDGNSTPEFLQSMKDLCIDFTVLTEGSMGLQRRKSFEQAVGEGDLICWTEPEKVDFIRSIPKLVETLVNTDADMVIPKRSSFESYPSFQQQTEPLLNTFWNNVTGQSNDICFGPRLFTKETATYFLNYTGEFGDRWESIILPTIDAIKDDKKIVDQTVEYVHPKTQTQNEEGNLDFDLKRLDQLFSLSKAFLAYWNR